MPSAHDPRTHVYVLKLLPSESCGKELQGRFEHMASGRRHDFHSTQSLIDFLRHEELQVAREQAMGDSSNPSNQEA